MKIDKCIASVYKLNKLWVRSTVRQIDIYVYISTYIQSRYICVASRIEYHIIYIVGGLLLYFGCVNYIFNTISGDFTRYTGALLENRTEMSLISV